MAGSTIGIKIADGSYYPVLEEGFTGSKRLTLTTVKDEQERVQIDLYRGDGRTLDHAQYIGSLVIENIPPAPQGEPEIELVLGLDAGGELSAEAIDRVTGEAQSFSMSLRTLTSEETYEVPEFTLEGESETETEALEPLAEVPEQPAEKPSAFEEEPLTGETYPVGEGDRRKEHLRRGAAGLHRRALDLQPDRGARKRRTNPLLVALLVLLAVALLAAIGWVAWQAFTGQTISPPWASWTAERRAAFASDEAGAGAAAASTQGSTVAATSSDTAAGAASVEETSTAAAASGVETAAAEPAAAATEPAATEQPSAGVTYRIKRGDTLWDIASTYYRNPWRYPRIARANNIKDPDFILAGARIFIPED